MQNSLPFSMTFGSPMPARQGVIEQCSTINVTTTATYYAANETFSGSSSGSFTSNVTGMPTSVISSTSGVLNVDINAPFRPATDILVPVTAGHKYSIDFDVVGFSSHSPAKHSVRCRVEMAGYPTQHFIYTTTSSVPTITVNVPSGFVGTNIRVEIASILSSSALLSNPYIHLDNFVVKHWVGVVNTSFDTVCSVWDKGYRYGFNGKEKDNEINVNGGDYDFGARIYDSRLGRWLSLDPLMMSYPSHSPYNFVLNNPIYNIDNAGRYVTGHTLKFMNDISTILQGVKGSEVFLSFLEVSCETNRLVTITPEQFEKSLTALGDNEDAKALIKGYYEAINSARTYLIYYVNNDSKLDPFLITGSPSFKDKHNGYLGSNVNENNIGGGAGVMQLSDNENESTFIFINHNYTMKLYKVNRYVWDSKSQDYLYSVSKPNYCFTENPIVSAISLIGAMWQANEPFIEKVRKSMEISEPTLIDGTYYPISYIEDKNKLQYKIDKICQNLMKTTLDDEDSKPPQELLPKKKPIKGKKPKNPPIKTPATMGRTSD